MTIINRNIGGRFIDLDFCYLDPYEVRLDVTNPRIAYPLLQLSSDDPIEKAVEMVLYSQENLQVLMASINQTRGVQEPIYVRHNGIVAEGNRRVAALRELKKKHPEDTAFESIPAFVIPENVPEKMIRELINAAHLDPKRPWAPFERAMELKNLSEGGQTVTELAETYEMRYSEVQEFIQAAELMIREYIPLLVDLTSPETKKKFSYFLEYAKGPRKGFINEIPDLDARFAGWVNNGQIPKADNVRKRLKKILASDAALEALENEGYAAAVEVVLDEDLMENPHYRLMEKTMRSLDRMSASALSDLKNDDSKKAVVLGLAKSIFTVADLAGIPIEGANEIL